MHRKNLHVLTKAHVSKVIFNGKYFNLVYEIFHLSAEEFCLTL